MKKTFLIACIVLGAFVVKGQNCAVATLNEKWLPKNYGKSEKIELLQSSNGVLSINPVKSMNERTVENKKVPFSLAILKVEDQTLIQFSELNYSQINIKEVLKMCKTGDEILIILQNKNDFSLPNHRLTVK